MRRLSAVAPVSGGPVAAMSIAECAYYKAQQRGFAPGCELDDWLAAEREVAAVLVEGKPVAARTKRSGNGNGAALKK